MDSQLIARCIKYCGRALALLWAGFWLYAGATSGGPPWSAVTHTLAPGGLFLALVVVEWKWESAGAWIMFAGGLFILLYASNQAEAQWTILLLAGPPLLGAMLLAAYHVMTPRPARTT